MAVLSAEKHLPLAIDLTDKGDVMHVDGEQITEEIVTSSCSLTLIVPFVRTLMSTDKNDPRGTRLDVTQ